MYFSYFAKFLLKISSNGPISLLKLILSRYTTEQSVVAITLACLTQFFSSAISPKQSPDLYVSTVLISFPNCFVALASPFSRMKNISPVSPSLIIYSPALNFWHLRASAIYSLSQASMSCKRSTFDKNCSYFSLFLDAASLTIWLKVCLSKLKRIQFSLATIVAALGALYRRANSPNESPSWYNFKKVSFWSLANYLKQSSFPLSMTYKLSPSWPCQITLSPALKVFSSMASMTIFYSYSSSDWNMKACDSLVLILLIYSSDLGTTLGLKSCFLLNLPQTSELTEVLIYYFAFYFSLFISSRSSPASSSESSLRFSSFMLFRDFSIYYPSFCSQEIIKFATWEGFFVTNSTTSFSRIGLTFLLR